MINWIEPPYRGTYRGFEVIVIGMYVQDGLVAVLIKEEGDFVAVPAHEVVSDMRYSRKTNAWATIDYTAVE